jgi:hypothetical protein
MRLWKGYTDGSIDMPPPSLALLVEYILVGELEMPPPFGKVEKGMRWISPGKMPPIDRSRLTFSITLCIKRLSFSSRSVTLTHRRPNPYTHRCRPAGVPWPPSDRSCGGGAAFVLPGWMRRWQIQACMQMEELAGAWLLPDLAS